MREQALGQKVGNRSGLGNHRRSSAATQRPARRESTGEALVGRLRTLLGYVPAVLKIGFGYSRGRRHFRWLSGRGVGQFLPGPKSRSAGHFASLRG